MEGTSVLSSPSREVRHEPTFTPMPSASSTPRPLKATASYHPNYVPAATSPGRRIIANGRMISSPLRTHTPLTSQNAAPLVSVSDGSPSRQTDSQPPVNKRAPLERLPTEPIAPVDPKKLDLQPTTEELRELKITVRDFAYETKLLPPVPSVPKPEDRELKRRRDELPEDFEARKRHAQRRADFMKPRPRPKNMTLDGNNLPSNIPPPPPPRRAAGPSVNTNAVAGPSSASGSTVRSLGREKTERVILPLPVRRSSPPHHNSPGLTIITSALGLKPNPAILFDSQPESQGESQPESQSQATGDSQPPVPDLSTSQTDSENDGDEFDLELRHDEDGLIKTPLVTPNGSLFYPDDELEGINIPEPANTAPVFEMDDSNVIDSSALPESQVETLLVPNIAGDEDDLSVSQMGVGQSQDLESQPVWQQQSQSPKRGEEERDQKEKEEGNDVDMAPEPANEAEDRPESLITSTITPSPRIEMPTIVSPTRPSASISSNNAPTTPRSHPLSCEESIFSPTRRSPSKSSSPLQSAHALFRRRSSLSESLGIHRRTSPTLVRSPSALMAMSKSKGKGKAKVSTSPVASTLGKGRYNLRTPSPKKAKLFGMPSTMAAAAAAAAHKVRARGRGKGKGKGKGADVAMEEDVLAGETGEGGSEDSEMVPEAPVLRRSGRGTTN